MTEEEANEYSDCGYGCHIIGGPWIAENPRCPVHGDNPITPMPDVDTLANIIREVDGNHDKGAGELAELIIEKCKVMLKTEIVV